MNLCLNGYTPDLSVYQMKNNHKLYLCDCGEAGTVKSGEAFTIYSEAGLYICGGAIVNISST